MDVTRNFVARRHFHGIDLCRAILLLGGPIVHSANIDPAFNGPISFGSGLFRMAAFFAISGFLGAQTCGKPRWLENRMIQVGIPALTGLLIINPLLTVAGGIGGDGLGVYWFLVALLIYMPLGLWMGSRLAIVERLPVLVAAALACALLAGLVRGTPVSPIIAHLPFYLLGWAVGGQRQPALRLGPAILVIALILPVTVLCHGDSSFSVKALGSLTTAIVRGASAWIVLSIALQIRNIPLWTAPLVASAYTIYMTHLPIIVAVHAAIGRNGPDVMMLAILVSLGGSFLFHRYVIKNSQFLMFLLNGKISRQHDLQIWLTAGEGK